MIKKSVAAAALLSLSFGISAQGGEIVYAPQEKDHTRDGILVREIQIQKGDTLSSISRRFTGKGSYYPQILLFNDIKNPNRIYAGKMLKVPVEKHHQESGAAVTGGAPNAQPAPAAETTTNEPKKDVQVARQDRKPSPAAEPTDMALEREAATKDKRSKKQGKQAKQPVKQVKQKASTTADQTDGQRLFEQAVQAYKREDCTKSVELFDRFLAGNASSPLAADAALYKADCYMKLSK